MSARFSPGAPERLVSLAAPAAMDASLWLAHLDAFGDQDARLCTPEERTAAGRFRFAHLGARWIAARCVLRIVLGSALGLDPREVAFSEGPFGKPALRPPLTGWHFNLSHSGGLALVGLRRSGPIGVDVEVLREGAADSLLVERLFTSAEQREWRQAPAESRDRSFLSAWTRKEACVKALGVGLSMDAKAVDAGCRAQPRQVQVTVAGRTGSVAVQSLETGAAAVAAVATAEQEFARHACERLA